MGSQSKEATLREVLAEVTLLDVGDIFKLVASALGCLGLALIFSLLIGLAVEFFNPTGNSGLAIPEWVVWLLVLWMFIGGYTSEKSYHEHSFAWYFPKLGWLRSIPLTLYIFVAVHLFQEIERDAGWDVKGLQLVLALLWIAPFIFAILALEIGHKKLMEKRAASNTSKTG